MSSRRFVLAFLVAQVLLFAGLVCLVSFGRMFFMPPEYAMWRAKEVLIGRVDSSSIVLLGDSRAMAAFVPEQISPRFVNLALGGATPIEAYYILRSILERTTPRQVVLSFGPYHYEIADSFWERAAKFDKSWLGTPELEEILTLADRLGDTHTVGRFLGEAPNRLPLSLRYNLPTAYKGDLISAPPWRYLENRRMMRATLEARGHHLFGNADHAWGKADEVTDRPFSGSPLIEHYLRAIVDACRQRGIPVRMVTPPLPEIQRPALARVRYGEGFERWMQGLALELDLSRAGLRFEDDALFGDHSHLNERGAAWFSRQIRVSMQMPPPLRDEAASLQPPR